MKTAKRYQCNARILLDCQRKALLRMALCSIRNIFKEEARRTTIVVWSQTEIAVFVQTHHRFGMNGFQHVISFSSSIKTDLQRFYPQINKICRPNDLTSKKKNQCILLLLSCVIFQQKYKLRFDFNDYSQNTMKQ